MTPEWTIAINALKLAAILATVVVLGMVGRMR